MSELKNTRARLVRALKPFNAMPVENRVREGTPDVNFAGGWIECKRMANWPANADKNPVRLPHPLLQTQRVWIKSRSRSAYKELILVCLHVRSEWLFFDGLEACEILGTSTKPELMNQARLCLKGLNEKSLVSWIQISLEALRSENCL